MLESNPLYAHIRFKDGREDTVSVSDLAPYSCDEQARQGRVSTPSCDIDPNTSGESSAKDKSFEINTNEENSADSATEMAIKRNDGQEASTVDSSIQNAPRRSQRIRRSVDRLNYS